MIDLLQVKLVILAALFMFLPLNAATYFFFRLPRRRLEVKRLLEALRMDGEYSETFQQAKPGRYLLLSVLYLSVVTLAGFALLLFPTELQLDTLPTYTFGASRVAFPAEGSGLMFGAAFLGAYLWGVQYLSRRYMANDINPGVYYGTGLRMVLAGTLAVVVFNAYESLSGGGGVAAGIWPAMCFVLGMFPQRGLSWLRDRIPILSSGGNDSVRPTPLEMIEGVTIYDRLRLEEHGIDNCYDLANADFVPLVIHTPYSARGLIDWMLQAKLAVYCSEGMRDLRRSGIRTILDLESLSSADIEALAQETALTKSALLHAQATLGRDGELVRLQEVGHRLGLFARLETDQRHPSPAPSSWQRPLG